jgi:hypothetical protein
MLLFGFVFLSKSSGHYIFIERKVHKTQGERFESTLHYQLLHNALLCDLHDLRRIVNASCVAFMDALAAAAPCCETVEAAMATAARSCRGSSSSARRSLETPPFQNRGSCWETV